jgi:mannose-6-phosphate isomerase-like protein (cupin superfamily)
MQMPPRAGGPPLHVHPTHGEGFYVLEGQLAFQVGSEVVTAGPGTWLFAPRNVPHTLANPGDQLGTVLCFFAPGGFERRFARALAQQAGGSLPADLEALSEAERLTKAVGPPLQF